MRSEKEGRLIGQILIEQKIITSLQLKSALAYQQENGHSICSIIVKLGFADSADVFKVLSKQLNIEYVDLKTVEIDSVAVKSVPAKIALHYKIFPYARQGEVLKIALADPANIEKLDDMVLVLDSAIQPVLGYEEDIADCIRRFYGVGADIIEDIMANPDVPKQTETKVEHIDDIASVVDDASVIKFVNKLFLQALEERATDIHFEPFENELRVRFRIDGFLYEVPIPEFLRLFHRAIVSRIKVMANLDIAEHRTSQDGRIRVRIKGEDIDLRVSVLPSYLGESIQIRILNAKSFLNLEQLGLLPEDLEKIQALIHKTNGIIFVTGPTGSGKSTSLYSCLSKRNNADIKIITAEDPVEYQMRGVTQIQIHPKAGVTFASSLRSMLRHDPDIIMVGEVRDLETAEITIRAAMTGHLVFSTLHTNDATSAPVRLVDMGIEPFLLASSLEAVIAQRLVRVICPYCKQPIDVSSDIFRSERVDIPADVKIFEGKGCKECRFTGYRGRTALFEIMVLTDEIRDLIVNKSAAQNIKLKACELGMATLRQDGLIKVLKGVTTLSEVMRVT